MPPHDAGAATATTSAGAAAARADLAFARPQRQRLQIATLLVLALLLAGALLWGIAYHQGLFGDRARLYFVADDVTGLAPGTTVRLSGFRVGKIEDLQLQDDQSVKVTLAVEEDIFARLRRDARAMVVREQLRPAAIELKVGQAAERLSAADPRVAYTRRGTLGEIADDLRTRLAPILDDMRQLSSMARDRKGDLDTILQNTTALSGALAATAQQLQALSSEVRRNVAGLGTQSEQAMQQANRSLVRFDGLLVQADRGLDSVNNRLPSLLEKADKTLLQLDAVLSNTRTITAAAAAGLPTLLRSAPPLVEESREMLQGLREGWPMRALLPTPPPPLLPIHSHDAAALREPELKPGGTAPPKPDGTR